MDNPGFSFSRSKRDFQSSLRPASILGPKGEKDWGQKQAKNRPQLKIGEGNYGCEKEQGRKTLGRKLKREVGEKGGLNHVLIRDRKIRNVKASMALGSNDYKTI